MNSSTSYKIVVHIEHLDSRRFDEDRYIQLLLDVYRYKYSKPKPDLIIPVLNSAVDLMLKHGPDLFPGIPIVFGGVESKFIENRSLGPNITGYLSDNNYTGTLDLALNLHRIPGMLRLLRVRVLSVADGVKLAGKRLRHMRNVSILPT